MSGRARPHAHSVGRSLATAQDSNSLRRSIPSGRTFRPLDVNESIRTRFAEQRHRPLLREAITSRSLSNLAVLMAGTMNSSIEVKPSKSASGYHEPRRLHAVTRFDSAPSRRDTVHGRRLKVRRGTRQIWTLTWSLDSRWS